MNSGPQTLYPALQAWAVSAREAGWLGDRELSRLEQVEQQQAEALFQGQGERPLIVAFFGGTGVGKSSLLNRLAGAPIARVGVQRPTSQEVTLYLHRSCRLTDLPQDLPLDETRIAYHDDDSRRLVAWLDLPDIDSVEARHRQLVQAWLPYVDWLIYVVSPERYQDEQGWRFVQQRGGRHAWLFVMNQWDLGGTEAQIEDFSRRLRGEGFRSPIILRTRCGPEAGDDDFPRLEQTITQAIRAYGLERLQQLGTQAREQELRRIGADYLERLGRCRLAAFQEGWQQVVDSHLDSIRAELAQNRGLLTRSYAAPRVSWWRRPKAEAVDLGPDRLLDQLWGERIETRVEELVIELENTLLQHDLPRRPFEAGLARLRDDARNRFREAARQPVLQALTRPGGAVRRATHRLLSALSWLLPLGAAGWAAFHLVRQFYLGTRGEGAFLGLDFAVHAILLIGLAWFIPWLLGLKLEPDPAAIVEGALKAGSEAGVQALQSLAQEVLSGSCAGVDGLEQALTRLLETPAEPPSPLPVADWKRTANPREGG